MTKTYDLPDDDTRARIIAAAWHGGMSSPLYSFQSTGAISLPGLVREIEGNLNSQNTYGRDDDNLQWLLAYVQERGERDRQEGWANRTGWSSDDERAVWGDDA